MKKLGRVSKDAFVVGDPVRVKDMRIKKWTIKEIIDEEQQSSDDAARS